MFLGGPVRVHMHEGCGCSSFSCCQEITKKRLGPDLNINININDSCRSSYQCSTNFTFQRPITPRASIKARSSPLHRHSGDASGDACCNILAQNGLRIATVAMRFRACEGLHRQGIATQHLPCCPQSPTSGSEQLILNYNMASIGRMQS
jgi:hypothetical protein